MRVHYQIFEAERHRKYSFMDQIWTLCLEKFTFQRYPWKKVEPECKSWNGILPVFQKRKDQQQPILIRMINHIKTTYWVSF